MRISFDQFFTDSKALFQAFESWRLIPSIWLYIIHIKAILLQSSWCFWATMIRRQRNQGMLKANSLIHIL